MIRTIIDSPSMASYQLSKGDTMETSWEESPSGPARKLNDRLSAN